MQRATVEMIRPLPFVVRQRVGGYLDNVHDQLLDLLMESDQTALLRQVAGDVEIIFVLRFFYRQFSLGYANYPRTLSYLNAKQVAGYRIGGTDYTSTSEVALSWEALADAVSGLSDDPTIRSFVVREDSVRNILRRFLAAYWNVNL